jgi:hypothetical protein
VLSETPLGASHVILRVLKSGMRISDNGIVFIQAIEMPQVWRVAVIEASSPLFFSMLY